MRKFAEVMNDWWPALVLVFVGLLGSLIVVLDNRKDLRIFQAGYEEGMNTALQIVVLRRFPPTNHVESAFTRWRR